MVSAWITSGWLAFGEDLAALVDVVAVQPDHERLVGLVAKHVQCGHDSVGDGVARSDATEHVHEHALDLLIVQDHVQACGHHLGRRAATDVEEVGRLDATVLLARVSDDVERGHHQTRAIADDADLAVELDVVEVVLLGFQLQRVGGVAVFELDVAGLTEVGVGVQGDLAVQRQDLSSGVRTSGLTSTRVASSPTNTSHSLAMVIAAASSTSAGR